MNNHYLFFKHFIDIFVLSFTKKQKQIILSSVFVLKKLKNTILN